MPAQDFPYPFDTTQQGEVDASGALTLTFDTGGQLNWIVSQVSIEMEDAPAGAECRLRKNQTFVTFLIPTGDAAGGDPPLFLRPGELMTVEWTGCTPGIQGKAFVIYEKVGYAR
jgi:hypothetical protein